MIPNPLIYFSVCASIAALIVAARGQIQYSVVLSILAFLSIGIQISIDRRFGHA